MEHADLIDDSRPLRDVTPAFYNSTIFEAEPEPQDAHQLTEPQAVSADDDEANGLSVFDRENTQEFIDKVNRNLPLNQRLNMADLGDDDIISLIKGLEKEPARLRLGQFLVGLTYQEISSEENSRYQTVYMSLSRSAMQIANQRIVRSPAAHDNKVVVSDDEVWEGYNGRRRPLIPVVTTDSIHDYLHKLKEVPLLNREQEVNLAKRIEAGLYAAKLLAGQSDHDSASRQELQQIVTDGEWARQLFIEANLRYVVSIAKRYTGRGVPFLDLIQDGNLGLMHAIEKFDYQKGYKFSTYAKWWIENRIWLERARTEQAIYRPKGLVEKIQSHEKAALELARELQRQPSLEEIAEYLETTVEDVHKTREYAKDPHSLDEIFGDSNGTARSDLLIDDDTLANPADRTVKQEQSAQLEEAFSSLTDDEQTVVRWLMGFNGPVNYSLPTTSYVAKQLGITTARVRHLEQSGMKKLRNSWHLRSLLDTA